MERKLDSYMYPLRIDGEFDIEKDKVAIISIEQNDIRVKDEMFGVNYYDYRNMIIAYLEEQNIDYETASDEQIEEACKKVAEQLFEEYCDWYED